MSWEQLKILSAEKIPLFYHTVVSFVKPAFSLPGWSSKKESREKLPGLLFFFFFFLFFPLICHIPLLFHQPVLKPCLEAAHLGPNSLSKQYSSYHNWQAKLAAMVTEGISWSFQETNIICSPCLNKPTSSLNVTGEKPQVRHKVGYSDQQ